MTVLLVEVAAHALNIMMTLLQVLGEDFRSIASRTGMADRSTTLHRAFCLPECKLAADNYTVSVNFLRGATGKPSSALYRPIALPCVSIGQVPCLLSRAVSININTAIHHALSA